MDSLKTARSLLNDERIFPHFRLREVLKLSGRLDQFPDLTEAVQESLLTSCLQICRIASADEILFNAVNLLLDRSKPRFQERVFLLENMLPACDYQTFKSVEKVLEKWLLHLENHPMENPLLARVGLVFYQEIQRLFGTLPPERAIELLKFHKNSAWYSGEEGLIHRMALAEAIRRLSVRVDGRLSGDLLSLVRELLDRERAFIRSSRGTSEGISPVNSTFLGKYLTQPLESPSIYPLLDAVDPIFSHLQERPRVRDILFLIDLLEEAEPRVNPEEYSRKRYPHRRLWSEVSALLTRWSHLRHLNWAAEWRGALLGLRDERLKPPSEGELTEVLGFLGEFFGVRSGGSRTALLMDFSASMKSGEVDYSSPLKKEVVQFLQSLPEGAPFNLIPFHSRSTPEMALNGKASPYMKQTPVGQVDRKVLHFLAALSPRGETVIEQAFRVAFTQARSAPGRLYYDEIIFLTDGFATDGKGNLIGGDRLLSLKAYIFGMAKKHAIRVHCIGMPGADEAFLKEISGFTGGQFQVVGAGR